MSTNQPVIDTIFYNGNITTLDKANPTAQAVAISQGKFVAVHFSHVGQPNSLYQPKRQTGITRAV